MQCAGRVASNQVIFVMIAYNNLGPLSKLVGEMLETAPFRAGLRTREPRTGSEVEQRLHAKSGLHWSFSERM